YVFMVPRPPRSPLFPYTTLFRSHVDGAVGLERVVAGQSRLGVLVLAREHAERVAVVEVNRDRLAVENDPGLRLGGDALLGRGQRSEEHTSELQSRENLVCRLLLE